MTKGQVQEREAMWGHIHPQMQETVQPPTLERLPELWVHIFKEHTDGNHPNSAIWEHILENGHKYLMENTQVLARGPPDSHPPAALNCDCRLQIHPAMLQPLSRDHPGLLSHDHPGQTIPVM